MNSLLNNLQELAQLIDKANKVEDFSQHDHATLNREVSCPDCFKYYELRPKVQTTLYNNNVGVSQLAKALIRAVMTLQALDHPTYKTDDICKNALMEIEKCFEEKEK